MTSQADQLKAVGLRSRRQAAGLTIEQFAVRAGLSASTISRIERGESAPNTGTLMLLASALGLKSFLDLRTSDMTRRDPHER